MITRFLSLLFLLILVSHLSFGQNSSDLVYLNQGALSYVPFPMLGQTNAVNVIPDFSFAGYKGGGVSLPTNIPIKAIVTPEDGDDTQRIQLAIKDVEALEPDQNGFRGVVLLKAGHYSLNNILAIRASGVIVRGEGQDMNGTVLHANPRVEHSVINILGSSGITVDVESEQEIISEYVPVGSYSFLVEDASDFVVGEKIVVTKKPNQFWIDELGMDQQTLCAGDADCVGWTPSAYTINHERQITAISGDSISINIPIVDVIQKEFGGGAISKIKTTGRINQCGIENMRIQSFYENNVDESHAWTAIRLKDSEHSWVKQVTGQYLAYSTVNIESANFITVQDCAFIEPKSKITGGRRYSFAIQEGLGNLFQRCYTTDGRHDFVTGSRVTGPNVFLDGLAERANSDVGPHHRWATGTLFDNIKAGSTRVWNRGSSGTGHGWSGAQTMFWNIESYNGEFRVDSPHGSINWGIGCIGSNQTGDGYWESWNNHVQPRSLYIQQLADRLGTSAIDNVILTAQHSGNIYELLSNWKGEGNISNGGFSGDIPDVSFTFPTDEIDVSIWEGGEILVEAKDNDGAIINVKLLINGEPLAEDSVSPYSFTNLKDPIQSLSHEVHFLQAIATDNDGNTNSARITIIGGDPPLEPEEEEEEDLPKDISIFPNPVTTGVFTIQMNKMGIYTIRIFDMNGLLINQKSFEGTNYQFQETSLQDGMYYLEILDAEEILFQNKLVIL